MDCLGVRGEGPIHIAVYRNDVPMLLLLLNHTPRADINLRNINGDTALHIAALMGLPDILRLLYSYATSVERFQLMLELKNHRGEMSLDNAQKPVESHELDLTRLYAVSDNVESLDSVREVMICGRRECAEFLHHQLLEDRENKIKNSVEVLIDCSIARRKANSILRGGVVGTDDERVYSAALDYPKALDPMAWRRADIQFFLNYEPGVREVVLGTHARDLVTRTQLSACRKVDLQEQVIHCHTSKLDFEQELWRTPPESFGKSWAPNPNG